MKGQKELGAEVIDDALGGTALGKGLAQEALVATEEAFLLVGGGGDAGVLVADEQVRAIASREGADGVDEVGGRDAQADAGCGGGQGLEEGLKAPLRLGGVGAFEGVWVGDQMMGDLTKDVDVAVYPTGQMGALPVGGQGQVEGI
jgi:hypothetical protein